MAEVNSVQEPVHFFQEAVIGSADLFPCPCQGQYAATLVQYRRGSVVPHRHCLFLQEFSVHAQTFVAVPAVVCQLEVAVWVAFAADLVLHYHRRDWMHSHFVQEKESGDETGNCHHHRLLPVEWVVSSFHQGFYLLLE